MINKAHPLGRHCDLNTSEALPRERGKRPTRLACHAHEFDENKVDARMKTHWCGDLNVLCEEFIALRWGEEKPSFCCQNGKVTFPLPPLP